MGITLKTMRTLLAAMAIGTALLAGQAGATEFGGGAYPNGAEDFMSGAVPPPGYYFINYFDHYAASTFKDNHGNSAIPGFKLNANAEVLRFIHITDKQILGGFYGYHMFIPFMYVDVKAAGTSDSRGGLGDVIVDPFILSWHGKNWHAATGVDIYVPTGAYDKNHLANLGRNYWTFEPILAGTYICDSGFETSVKMMYDFNTTNTDTHYTSGNEFHLDYTVAKKVGPVNLGVAGYYYQQITGDEVNGVQVPDNKGRVVSVGPAIKYDYKNMSLSLKYEFEMAAKNRPQGDNLWFKFIYAF